MRGGTRTPYPQLRRLLLCPDELRAHIPRNTLGLTSKQFSTRLTPQDCDEVTQLSSLTQVYQCISGYGLIKNCLPGNSNQTIASGNTPPECVCEHGVTVCTLQSSTSTCVLFNKPSNTWTLLVKNYC